LLELFQANGDAEWLEWAIVLQSQQDELFWDPKDGGWFSTTGEDPTVLLRLKEDYDGAEPAASSIASLNVLTLSHLTGDDDARGKAERTLARYGPRVGVAGRTVPMMLCALSGTHAGYSQVVIVGSTEQALPLRRELARHYRPFAIVVPMAPGAAQERLGAILPFTAAMTDLGSAAAYVCRDFTCQRPVATTQGLAMAL
jgi:uncharacterized protein YyaL (SSP411 family)